MPGAAGSTCRPRICAVSASAKRSCARGSAARRCWPCCASKATGRGRRELQAAGHRLRTKSDSEIALHLYEDLGASFLRQLRGEFALALWDDTNQVLLAVLPDRLLHRVKRILPAGEQAGSGESFDWLGLALFAPAPLHLEMARDNREFTGGEQGKYQYALDEILEISVSRSFLWPTEAGLCSFKISLYEGDQKLESCPDGESLSIEVPERRREVFWTT